MVQAEGEMTPWRCGAQHWCVVVVPSFTLWVYNIYMCDMSLNPFPTLIPYTIQWDQDLRDRSIVP